VSKVDGLEEAAGLSYRRMVPTCLDRRISPGLV